MIGEEEDFRITVCEGKYTYIFYKSGAAEVLRYGQKWKLATGDKCLLAFASELHELRKKYS